MFTIPIFTTAPFLYLVIIILIVTINNLPSSLCADNDQYLSCGGSFACANIPALRYPFWGNNRAEHCGHPAFRLNCQGEAPVITIESRPYRVLNIDSRSDTITVAREDLWNNTCPSVLYNTTLDNILFSQTSGNRDLTLFYGCGSVPGQPLQFPNKFDCRLNDTTNRDSYFVTTVGAILVPNLILLTCSNRVIVPVKEAAARVLTSTSVTEDDLRAALRGGFELEWDANNTNCDECAQSNGRCGYNSTSSSFACYCADQPYPFTCNGADNDNSSSGKTLRVVLPVIGAVLAVIVIGWLIFYCRQRKKRLAAQSAHERVSKDGQTPSMKGTPSNHFTRSIPSYPSKSMSAKESTYFGVPVFSYTELEEATDNFDSSRELGDGGFGTVYYGTLHDGRVVAVKRLYENNFKRVEQFMNEVKILTGLYHENLVKLYGCTSKRSRELLLVYEYIPNGTVADHLHGKQAKSGLLSWPVRLNIAIETADALSYLHASDIIHRDVKTNNILLDDKFCVKVADFGLSRLFPNDATHVSTAPQGTPGYVDPEYYQWYKLTDKSDVYSFGVVLIELVSSLQALDTNRNGQDIILANMAISKIQNQELNCLVDKSLGFETDTSVRRMITLVAELAFRCLQQDKDMRPSMKEVLETLRNIRDEELKAPNIVIDISVDDTVPLKGNHFPVSPDSVADKWVSGSSVSSTG